MAAAMEDQVKEVTESTAGNHAENAADPTVQTFADIASLLAPVTVVCGHYGVGKTSLSVSLAIDAARAGWDVALSDLDVVNPYFRSSDCKKALDSEGVRLIEPVYARSNVDGPSITNETSGAVEWASAPGDAEAPRKLLIIDAGGDDAGATALGRFAADINAVPHAMLYVVNRNRGFDHTPEEAVGLLREIEEASHLKATAVVGNTHLKAETTVQTVSAGIPFAQQTAQLAGLPLALVTIPQPCVDQLAESAAINGQEAPENVGGERHASKEDVSRIRQMLGATPLYGMGIYVKTPWE